MNIVSSDDCIGVLNKHPLSTHFTVIGYKDGAFSCIPKSFFQDWRGEVTEPESFQIGRCSGLGAGSIVSYGQNHQKLVIGKYVAGGQRLRFVLNGQHEMRTISTSMFDIYGMGLASSPIPQYTDTIIRNDVWMGDEAFFLGGSIVESGCVIGARAVIPPNFRSEPYGIYVGSPARLTRFRFSEKVREKLLQLAWWDMPLDWVKHNNNAFLVDLTADEGRALDVLAALQEAKDQFIEQMRVAAEYPLDALNALHLTEPTQPTQLDEHDQTDAAAAEGAPSSALTAAQVAALADEYISTLIALRQLGQHEQVEAVARQMTLMLPEHAYGWQALGSALLAQGRADAASGPLERADALLPAAARPVPTADQQKQVVALYQNGRTAEAVTMAQGLTERYKHHALGWRVLGLARAAEAQFDAAIEPLRRAREFDPQDFDVILTLADVLRHQGRTAEAELEARHLTQLAPERIEGHCVLGLALQLQDRYEEADVSVRRALEIAPGDTRVLATLASILLRSGRLAEARDICGRALKIDPDMSAVRSNLLFAMAHDEAVDDQTLLAQHRLFGKLIEDKLTAYRKPHRNSRDPQRCLRVGFVSGDLYAHAVASFFAPVLHDLAREPGLTLHAYYNNTLEDAVSQQLRAKFASWTPVSHLSDDALDEKIRADGIDILVDLSGHTGLNRLPVFARKPAPIQVSWLGYPATTGMRTMDYYFADRVFVPPREAENRFVEKIVYLPASAPFVPADVAPPINRLPALTNGYITFGSFNRLSKLRPAVIKLWAQLLKAVPTARMLIGGVSEDSYNKLVDWFEQEGIDRTRLESRPRLQMRVYLQQHHAVDICLDTFPYAGGTTTLHAAWMGVPTLTLPGRSAASRGGAAIMSPLELESFIASDPADFVEKGVDWANKLATLAELRAHMRERCARSAYFQPEVVAEGMSRALRLMWQRWTEGKPPVTFDSSLPAAHEVL